MRAQHLPGFPARRRKVPRVRPRAAAPALQLKVLRRLRATRPQGEAQSLLITPTAAVRWLRATCPQGEAQSLLTIPTAAVRWLRAPHPAHTAAIPIDNPYWSCEVHALHALKVRRPCSRNSY